MFPRSKNRGTHISVPITKDPMKTTVEISDSLFAKCAGWLYVKALLFEPWWNAVFIT
jgi:hypothetical protein